jgi:hypothetical protein
MLTLFQTCNREQSLEEKILSMSDDDVQYKIPEQLRETGLFSEDEIDRAVVWLREFRSHHHLDVIE